MQDNEQQEKEIVQLPKETPKQMVKYGKKSAKQLIDLVKQNDWAVNIQGRDYLQFEAWQTVGRFFGYTVRTVSTDYVEYGEAKGFEAKVEVLDSEGNVIGGAEAVCLNDEDNWQTEEHKNRYGKTVPGKPLYALKSMAQTRASGKAMRMLLSWVVVLAGYKPTPAEEMDGVDTGSSSKSKSSGSADQGEVMVSSAQIQLLNKLRKEGKHEYSEEDVSEMTLDEASKAIQEAIKTKENTY